MTSVDPLAEAAREMLGVLQSIDFSGTHMSYDDVPFAKWEAAVAAAELQSTIPPHGGHAMNATVIFRCNARQYTAEDIRLSAYRHGEHGLIYYPPHVWGTDDEGWPWDDAAPCTARPGHAARIYHAGYVAGRQAWRDRFAYPTEATQ